MENPDSTLEPPTGDRSHAAGHPGALGVFEGSFRSLYAPAPPPPGTDFKSPRLPEALPEPWAPAEGDAARGEATRVDGRVSVYLTIDTEDGYFPGAQLLTGDGLGSSFGTYGILDALDQCGLRATFFVNVYESGTHRAPDLIERLTKEIAERGHEIALHTHASSTLDFYSRPLSSYDADQQERILSHGVELIEGWTGLRPVTFRAGAYSLSDATFEALERLGFLIDSSSFFISENNRITPFTINAVRMRGSLIEVPVTYVIRALPGGELEHRKFDLDWLRAEELDQVLLRLRQFGIGTGMFMMHSFSFLDKVTRADDEPGWADALYRSPSVDGRYAEIYGARPDRWATFERFLARLARDPAYRVETLGASVEGLSAAARSQQPDLVPVVASSAER
jgi:peptidoglycan/xylan/chitin deacetylase (PgdA/CDA1 family)